MDTKIRVMGSTAYVITDIDDAALERILKVGDIRAEDENGNQVLAVDRNLSAGEPLKSNLVLFNEIVEGKAAIAVQMSPRIAKLGAEAQREAMVKVIAQYWDNIQIAVAMVTSACEQYDATIADVAKAFA